MKSNKAIILLFILICAIPLNGQVSGSGVGGSVYSRFGIGDRSPGFSYFNGLAGTSMAMASESTPNLQNPAMLSYLTLTRFETGYNFNQYKTSNQNAGLYQFNSFVTGLSVSMAIDSGNGIGISFGFRPFSSVGYSSSELVLAKNEFSESEGQVLVSGAGGLSSAYFGISARLWDISIGVMPLYYFGEIKRNEDVLFNLASSGDNSYNSYRTLTDNFSGAGIKLGIAYEVNDQLKLGFSFTPQTQITVNRQLNFTSDFLNTTRLDTSNNILLPMSYGLGFSYRMSKYLLGADFNFFQFSSLNYNNPSKANEFADTWSLSAGLLIEGSHLSGANVFKKTDFMFGLGYKPMYMSFDSEQMSDLFFSFGISVPFGKNALFNTSLLFGQRGRIGNITAEEKYAKFVFSLSIGEQWFKPFRSD